MTLRAPRRLTLLALLAPAVAVLPGAVPASATRADVVSPAYLVDEWAWGDPARLPVEPYSRVEVTYDATYGITMDGQVRTSLPTWSSLGDVLVAPSFARPIVDVTGGTRFGLAIDDEGHLHSWGEAPTISGDDRAETYRDVAAVAESAIGVTADGQVRYWGSAEGNYEFDPAELAGADVVAVDVDSAAAVAVTAQGRVLSAGGGINGDWNPAWSFPSERAEETFVAADAGEAFALALTEDGEIVAWGVDQHGQLEVPAFPEGRHAVAISAGMWMAAAVLDDGSVVRWGEGEHTEIPSAGNGLPVVDVDLDRYRAAVTYAALVSTGAPSITGTPQFGETLSASPAGWSSTPDEIHYEWRAQGSDMTYTVGQDTPTYTPSADDVSGARRISVTITAMKDGFVAGSATSELTDPVASAQFTTAPTLELTGEAKVGRSLTATVATAAAPEPAGTHWAWFTVVRGDDPDSLEDDDLEPIPGATTDTLTVSPELAGRTVFANLTLTRPGFEPTFAETEDTVVVPGTFAAPQVSVAGKPRVGQTLSATVTSDPAAGPTYQWLRGGTPIAGAKARTYKPGAADVGQTLRVRVTTAAPGYTSATTTSAATAAVTLGPAKLKVTVPRSAKVGAKATITVRGLAAGERFTVRIGTQRLSGKATGAGVGKVTAKITGRPGSRAVKVVGSVADRAGASTLRVVRR